MIRRLIILLLIVSAFAQEFESREFQFFTKEMGELEKQLLYKQNDRSPLLAGICALTPTVGHIYVGKWNKRLLHPTLPIAVLSGLLIPIGDMDELFKEGTTARKHWGNLENYGFPLSTLTLGLWYPLQLQDAIYLAYQHNADLYEEIYGKEYIRPPKKSIIQKWIDKKEAKKKPKEDE